jgi:hypothetical protein
MKKIPKAIYQTADEIDARIRKRAAEAEKYAPDSAERRTILREIAQLQMYADAKRWIASPGLRPGS